MPLNNADNFWKSTYTILRYIQARSQCLRDALMSCSYVVLLPELGGWSGESDKKISKYKPQKHTEEFQNYFVSGNKESITLSFPVLQCSQVFK